MPAPCVVPKCGSRKSGHRFPRDQNRTMRWLAAIRRPTFKPSKHSRVCKDHFKSDDFEFPKETARINPLPRLKADAVPNTFKWTQESFPSVSSQGLNLDRPSLLKQSLHQKVASFDFRNTRDKSESVTASCALCGLQLRETPPTGCTVDHCMTTHTFRNLLLCTNQYFEGLLDLHHWTGLENFDHFASILNVVGDCAYDLFYFPALRPVRGSRLLTPCIELFLTLSKLYRDMPFEELGVKFGIPVSSVASIFITWVNLLYCVFKELDICLKHARLTGGACTQEGEGSCTVVMYCSEVNVQKPLNPVMQQLMFSRSKKRHTIKALVGVCASCGAIIYASDGYPGSMSSCEVFGKCQFQNFVQGGNVSSEVGSLIQDSQSAAVDLFSEEEGHNGSHLHTSKRNVLASYARAKVRSVVGSFGILSGQVCTSDQSLAGRILFVCCMLTNLKEGHIRVLLGESKDYTKFSGARAI